jgi:uncharacterized protein YggE
VKVIGKLEKVKIERFLKRPLKSFGFLVRKMYAEPRKTRELEGYQIFN